MITLIAQTSVQLPVDNVGGILFVAALFYAFAKWVN